MIYKETSREISGMSGEDGAAAEKQMPEVEVWGSGLDTYLETFCNIS
jgi:hypothetical protein